MKFTRILVFLFSTPLTVVAVDQAYIEDLTIKGSSDGGGLLCAGKNSDQGERCGVFESKKGKYRSIRVSPNKGKKFRFKITGGIPAL